MHYRFQGRLTNVIVVDSFFLYHVSSITITTTIATTIKKIRQVEGFTGLDLAMPGELWIKIGDQEELLIEADDNLIPYIETNVRNQRLEIRCKEKYDLKPTRPIRFTLTAKFLDATRLSGSGRIEAPDLAAERVTLQVSGSGDMNLGDLKSEEVKVRVSGSGDLRIKGIRSKNLAMGVKDSGNIILNYLEAEMIEAAISGSGSLNVGGGQVTNQRIAICGFGDYRADGMKSVMSEASIAGSGSAILWVQECLSGGISGSGDLYYTGNPKVEVVISGSGHVRSRK